MYTYFNNCEATNGINVISKKCAYILLLIFISLMKWLQNRSCFFLSFFIHLRCGTLHNTPEASNLSVDLNSGLSISCIRLAGKKRPLGGSSSASSRGVCSAESGSSRQPACVSSAMSAEMIPKARRTSLKPSLLTHIRSGEWNPDRNEQECLFKS